MIFENNDEYLKDELFLKELHSQRIKEHHIKIELLDFQENVIQEIQGKCASGSMNIDGNSSVRRTCSFSMIADHETYDITNINNLVSLNKKIRVYTGYTNTLYNYGHYGDIIWFPLGIFVITGLSINNGLGGSTINISAKDKMCLLNGDVGGTLTAPVVLHEKLIRNQNGSTTVQAPLIFEIIREAVIHLGGEDPARVIVNDIPLEGKKALRYVGNKSIYFDLNGNQVPQGTTGAREVKPGDLAGYNMINFTYPGELIKQAGESVVSILDSIKNVLGNYEYFYDVNGNFVFQEIKNYLNTSYTPITQLSGGDYSINLGESRLAYSFKESDIIISYSNNPNVLNIKNDFIVWGNKKTATGVELPIRYHVAIDDIPSVPKEPPYTFTESGKTQTVPWQVYLYMYGCLSITNGTDAGYYYTELANEIPKIHNIEIQVDENGNWVLDSDKQPIWKNLEKGWKDMDSASMDFYLDFIDTNSELGKYSIKTIGRRTKAVVDKDVTMLYRPPTPDYVLLEANEEGIADTIAKLNKIGQKFIVVEQKSLYEYAAFGKDAFSVIRDLIFKHTTYNESINVTSLPIYNLEPNIRVEVEDQRSNIYGEYIIKSISLPLSYEGTMSFSAVRATDRL